MASKPSQVRAGARIAVLAFAAVVAIETGASAEDAVTACGQELNRSARLEADLDCSGTSRALTIRNGATLALNGFSITGAAIVCEENCVLEGPGTVADIDGGSVVVQMTTVNGQIAAHNELRLIDSTVNGGTGGSQKAYVQGSTITGTGTQTYGVQAYRLTMVNSTVTNHGLAGVYCRSCSISGSNIYDNPAAGIMCGLLAIENSELTGNGSTAIQCTTRARITGTQITGNLRGVDVYFLINGGNWKGHVSVTDSRIDGNEFSGVNTKYATLRNSTVTNNGCSGVVANSKVRLETSDVSGNMTNPACSAGADLYSKQKPVLRDGAICGTSLGDGLDYDLTWGVCSLD